MEFREVLAKRRMIRNYSPAPLAAELVDEVAAAALRAPSAGNSQAIAVVVVTSPEKRTEIARIADEESYVEAGFDPWISRAPAHLVLAVSEQIYRDRYSEPDKLGPEGREIEWPVPYWWVDAGAALMAVLLAAVDRELGAGFLGVHSLPDLARIVGLPDHFQPIGVVTLGYPAPDRRSTSLNRPSRGPEEAIQHEEWTEPG